MVGEAVQGAFAVAAADEGLAAAEGGEAVVKVAFGFAGGGYEFREGGGAEVFDGSQGGVVASLKRGAAPGTPVAASSPLPRGAAR